jgi:hypothetical protein
VPGAGLGPVNATGTSPRQRCWPPPEKFRHRCLGLAPVGLRPPCATPRHRHTTSQPGRASTYRKRNGVQTKPATSLPHGRLLASLPAKHCPQSAHDVTATRRMRRKVTVLAAPLDRPNNPF